jgi:hypothetical protein
MDRGLPGLTFLAQHFYSSLFLYIEANLLLFFSIPIGLNLMLTIAEFLLAIKRGEC